MLRPKYTITNHLATNMRMIGELIGQFHEISFSDTVLFEMELNARILSSCSSTQIEGNPLQLTQVKKLIKTKPENILDTQREVLNYNNAIIKLEKQIVAGGIKKMTKQLICEVQSIVTDGLIQKPDQGNFRKCPVFVNNPIEKKTVYLPPDAQDVDALMDDLVDYINSIEDKVDPLIVAGIFHKQAVIIHPFLDGNGRTTRLITKVLLAKLGINTFPLFSFERYYNNNISKYFQNVGVYGDYYEIVDDIDFTNWLEYFTDGIIDELERVKDKLAEYKIRLGSDQTKIIQYIKENGSISNSEYAQITNRARATRIQDFRQLVELGLIKPKKAGKATYYVLSDKLG